MHLLISPSGAVRAVYGEAIDLMTLGALRITRGSHLEPDEEGRWTADLSPVGGPRLGPFKSRSMGLEAERNWLDQNWLRSTVAES